MTDSLPWSVIIIYCIYASFASFQKFCIRDLKGQSETFGMVLGFFAFFTMLFGIGFLIFYGFSTAWWAPIVLFFFGLLAYIPLGFLEEIIPLPILAFSSLIVIPVCAYYLIYLTP